MPTLLIVATCFIGSLIVLPLLGRLLTPTLDPREPPMLKPTIPLIGHIIGIIRHQNEFQETIHKAHPTTPIATLPMLTGKIYTVFDPHLIQSILRNKVAAFEPFAIDFAQKTFGLSNKTFAKVTTQPEMPLVFTDAIHRSFAPAALHQMNLHFLDNISKRLDAIVAGEVEEGDLPGCKQKMKNGSLEVDNLFLWCRDGMSLATTAALYGEADPFNQDRSLVSDIWTFESAVPFFLMSLFPSITMPKGYEARRVLQTTMAEYYTQERDLSDASTSQLVLNRANTMRQYGFTGEEIAKFEAILPVVATTNAVPTFFWMLVFILQRPDLVKQLRDEAEAAASYTVNSRNKTATFDISQFETQLPLMVSCYRETMRVINHSVSMRRMLDDLTVTAQDGRSYLLKKGVDVQMSAGVLHASSTIWGTDASDFQAERFLPTSAAIADAERLKKVGYIPFGGGKHLCPGRNLAFCEILGFMCGLFLRFDVEPLGMDFAGLKMQQAKLSSPSVRPVNSGKGLGARITVRKPWDEVEFKFEC